MYRTVASRAKALKGQTGHRGWARYATSSVAASNSSSGGLFSRLIGEKSSSLPPLDFPLEGISIPPPLPDRVETGETKITILPNGLTIASETTAHHAASIGLYVDCGTIYEKPSSFGATHLLERMAFKSSTNRSHLRIVREVEAIGGNVSASGSREYMGYTYDALKTYVPHMVELLVDCVRNPAFLDWEVNEQIKKLKADIEEFSKNPQELLFEAIHSTGYTGPFSNGLMASESGVDHLNSTVLEEFVTENYTASRMVLAASGVDHDKLLEYAEPLLFDLPNVPRTFKPKPVYQGGDFRRQGDSGVTHFSLAFELPGGWINEKDAVILTVLQMLLGGGDSFSVGGPGKGMYSRLYLKVLNEYPVIEHFSAFSAVYNHSALFGIQATTGVEFSEMAVDMAVRHLIEVANPREVTRIQLDYAQRTTKCAILMNLESRMIVAEDIGRQVLTYGERKPVDHYLAAVDEVTKEDIVRIARKLLSSPLTMASYGDVVRLPSYASVSSRFSRFR